MQDNPPATLLVAEAAKALDAGLAPGFPQKVAANALGIAMRELELGPVFAEEERVRLLAMLAGEGSVEALNRDLAIAIRDGSIRCNDPALINHLIRTTIAKLEVDQPSYPAFRQWKGEQ